MSALSTQSANIRISYSPSGPLQPQSLQSVPTQACGHAASNSALVPWNRIRARFWASILRKALAVSEAIVLAAASLSWLPRVLKLRTALPCAWLVGRGHNGSARLRSSTNHQPDRLEKNPAIMKFFTLLIAASVAISLAQAGSNTRRPMTRLRP
jgi:hypothetical protein